MSSGVARAVIRGLATSIMVSDETLLSSLSATLLSFSYLPANCSQLVEMGVFTCLPHLLDHGYRHEVRPALCVHVIVGRRGRGLWVGCGRVAWTRLGAYPSGEGGICPMFQSLSVRSCSRMGGPSLKVLESRWVGATSF